MLIGLGLATRPLSTIAWLFCSPMGKLGSKITTLTKTTVFKGVFWFCACYALLIFFVPLFVIFSWLKMPPSCVTQQIKQNLGGRWFLYQERIKGLAKTAVVIRALLTFYGPQTLCLPKMFSVGSQPLKRSWFHKSNETPSSGRIVSDLYDIFPPMPVFKK